jgi:polysaccharide export outer membrane protein
LQADQTVQQDGTIDLGDYGQFAVVNLTTQEIQQQVQQRIEARELQKQQNRIALASHPNRSERPLTQDDFGVSVRLVNNETGMVYVMGEVNAPGSYPLVGSETVLDAIIASGGLSDRANDHKIILTRPNFQGQPREILPVCFAQILQLGDVSTNYQLRPGDRIYVPSLSLAEDVRQSLLWRSNQSCPHCAKYD